MELLRPNLEDNETLTFDEKMDALHAYIGRLGLIGANVNQEFDWAIRQRIQLRAKELGYEA